MGGFPALTPLVSNHVLTDAPHRVPRRTGTLAERPFAKTGRPARLLHPVAWARHLSVAGDGDRPAAAVEGTKIAVAPAAGSAVVRLSRCAATERTRKHPEITPEMQALVQRAIDEGERFHDRERVRHLVGILEADRFPVLVAPKVTADRRSTRLQSMFMTGQRKLTGVRKGSRPIWRAPCRPPPRRSPEGMR